MELAWAQTAALAIRAGLPLRDPARSESPREPFSPAGKEADLAAWWPALDKKGIMEPWWKFLSAAAGGDPGSRDMARAFTALRDLRNDVAHLRIVEATERDLTDRAGHILRLIDLLAGWAETPLIESARRHPQQRGLIQFNALTNAPPWPARSAPDEYRDLPIQDHVFLRWHDGKEPFLLDLHPFVLLVRTGPRHEPAVFVSAERGNALGTFRGAVYRSLVTGKALTFTEANAAALLRLLAPLFARR